VLILPGLVSLILPGGLNPGIDFTSGTIMTMQFQRPEIIEQQDVRDELSKLGHGEAIVQRASGESPNTFVVRTRPLQQAATDESGQTGTSEREKIEQALTARFGPMQILNLDQVSALIAEEIVRYAIVAVGAVSILGRIFPAEVEVESTFIVAVLTVIGFSVHDTIVVFDRIRENFIRRPGEHFEDVVNHSLAQTLTRSLNTSLTVLLTLVVLLLFGGSTIFTFVLALLIGIGTGTYSSIFVASMLLVSWQVGDFHKLWPFGRTSVAPAGA
jgi:preprotein translocase subunit SecF